MKKRIDEIRIGDVVAQGYDGKPSKAVDIFTGIEDELLVITTSSGKSLWLTSNHPVLWKNKSWRVSAKYQGVPNTFAPTPITDVRVVSILL